MASARRGTAEKKVKGAYHHGNLRAALISAASVLLEKKGAIDFTLREAARAVGVDHGAVYRHFENRDALVAAVSTEGYLTLRSMSLKELAKAPANDARSRLVALARGYLLFATQFPGTYRLMTGPTMQYGEDRPDLTNAMEAGYTLMQEEIRAGIERGELLPVDPKEAALIFWASMHGLASLVLARRIWVKRTLIGAFAERAVGVTVRGMLSPSSPAIKR